MKRNDKPLSDYADFMLEFQQWCQKRDLNFRAEVMKAVAAYQVV